MIATAQTSYVPDRLYVRAYSKDTAGPSTLNITGGDNPIDIGELYSVTPIPDPFIVDESNINAPATGFTPNTHLFRFSTEGETTSLQQFGHKFQRSEAWDISFDVKIETNPMSPRKEAGFYFESSLGNDIFYVASNSGHYTPGPGEIQVQPGYNVLPDFAFATSAGPLGDYNHNGTVDAPDYVIWRGTLGSTTDFRANGDNEGASQDLIDEADYEVWRSAFGESTDSGTAYTIGDTLNMRMIYTPPVVDPGNSNPLTNVVTAGKVEYQIRLNGGPMQTSGELDFDNPLKGIPDNTLISMRVQNLSSAEYAPDWSKVTFSNIDVDGSGLVAAAVAGVPEPMTWLLLCVSLSAWGITHRGRRA